MSTTDGSAAYDRFLLAYFLDEHDEHGEQVRFAVSDGPAPVSWTALNAGEPVLRSDVGEHGARDPFLLRDHRTGVFVLLATDLRVWPTQDWDRAVRHGSRGILVWTSHDLVSWTAPYLVRVAPPEAGNTWAPKAIWSEERGCWMLVWASALFAGEDRSAGTYQRIMAAPTQDFVTFGPAEVYLDLGHDVIDAAFLHDGPDWYRFSVNTRPVPEDPGAGTHILVERGTSFDDPAYVPVAVDVGRGDLQRGEGPAVTRSADGTSYLLVDEFGLRGYHLFTTDGPPGGGWRLVPDARLPSGARHGSLLPITSDEAERLLTANWPHPHHS
ncbi:glycoside hydrolase family 43 protein [Streptomyces sp. NPDC005538]|uniref:glycoside hydrolase family 43 protein n=1 Tax=unclassified Streptomyces TaxID=2593676 RepID=UPI0033BF32E6